MAITRVSPGRYTDGKRTVTAKDSATAAKLLGGSTPTQTSSARKPSQARGLLAGTPTFTNDMIKDAPSTLQTQIGVNNYTATQNDYLNRANEQTAFGGVQYGKDASGRITRTESLSPGQSQINTAQEQYDIGAFESMTDAQKRARGMLSDPYSLNNMPQRQKYDPSQLGDIESANDWRNKSQQSALNFFDSRNNENFARDEELMRNRLAQQGVRAGTKRFDIEMNNLKQQQNDARQGAEQAAFAQGREETGQQFGMGLQRRQQLEGEQFRGYQTAAEDRTNAIGEYDKVRYAPIQEMNSFQSGVRGVVQPNFQGMANIDAGSVDVGGTALGFGSQAINQGQLNLARSRAGGSGGGGGGSNNNGLINSILTSQGQVAGGGVKPQSPFAGAFGSIGGAFGQGMVQGSFLNRR